MDNHVATEERTESSIALVQEAWRRIGAHDVPGFLDLLDEAVEWHIPEMPGVPFAGTWRGRDQVAHFFRTVAEAQETLLFEPHRIIAEGATVVVIGRFVNRVRTTGRESRSDWVQVWTVADGRIAAMREFVDTLAVSAAYLGDGQAS